MQSAHQSHLGRGEQPFQPAAASILECVKGEFAQAGFLHRDGRVRMTAEDEGDEPTHKRFVSDKERASNFAPAFL